MAKKKHHENFNYNGLRIPSLRYASPTPAQGQPLQGRSLPKDRCNMLCLRAQSYPAGAVWLRLCGPNWGCMASKRIRPAQKHSPACPVPKWQGRHSTGATGQSRSCCLSAEVEVPLSASALALSAQCWQPCCIDTARVIGLHCQSCSGFTCGSSQPLPCP